MTTFRAFLLAASLLVVGCGIHPTDDSEPKSATPVVQAADGTLYSIPCLREVAARMEATGRSAMDSCKVNASTEESSARGFYNRNSYAYIYYPPSYYSTNYWDPYCTTTTYNPYRNYQTSSPFCSYVFGSSNGNWNCYYILGYNNYTYTNSYKPNCSPCTSAYGSGYSCSSNSNSCWNSGYINWY